MLSLEQQSIIKDSLWVVNRNLELLGLQRDEDLRQECNLFLCRCLEHFKPSKSTKFTTYAFKSVYLFILKYKKRNAKYTRNVSTFSDKGETFTAENQLAVNPQHNIDNACLLKNLYAVCTPEEIEILELKRQGYKLVEIKAMTNRSVRQLSYIIGTIKQKAREEIQNNC